MVHTWNCWSCDYCTHKMLPTFNGAMSAFMNIYLQMVNMILNLLHNLHVGNWRGISNLSYCYSHILSLKEEDLKAFQHLHDGGFTGSVSGRPHSMIPVYQMIEMTRKGSCKEIEGLSGKQNTYSKHWIVYWEIYFTQGYNQRKALLRSNKEQVVNFFKEGNTKEKASNLEDEGQSFTDIISVFDNKILDLPKIMEWSVTSKPQSIYNQGNKKVKSEIFFLKSSGVVTTDSTYSDSTLRYPCLGCRCYASSYADTRVLLETSYLQILDDKCFKPFKFITRCWYACSLWRLPRCVGKMHAVYVSCLHKKQKCIVADDADVFILLLSVAQHFKTILFCQSKNSDTERIT